MTDWPLLLASELMERYEGLSLRLYRSGEFVVLERLVVVARGEGIGTAVMTAITTAADEHGDALAGTPNRLPGTTSKARLVRFYSRFGFQPNTGRTRNFDTRQAMIRPARGSA